MKNIALIFAGGVGSRMGSKVPKQFLEVYGKPIIVHVIEKFQYHDEIDEIYIACKKELIPNLKEQILKYNLNKVNVNNIVSGGATGQDSIYNGLCAIEKDYYANDVIVLIHDGVRPIVTEEVISMNIAATKKYGNSVTATPSYETPFITYDNEYVAELPKRSTVYTAQAPQTFILKDILEAHRKIRKINPDYTDIIDSCTLMKINGHKIKFIEGNKGNIKVTTPEDYIDLLSKFQAIDQKKFYDLIESRDMEISNRRTRK